MREEASSTRARTSPEPYLAAYVSTTLLLPAPNVRAARDIRKSGITSVRYGQRRASAAHARGRPCKRLFGALVGPPDDPARIAGRKCTRRYVARDHAASTDYGTRSDADAR
jgi:hypothetical protein